MASQGLMRLASRTLSVLCLTAALAGPAFADEIKLPDLPPDTVTGGAQPANLSAAKLAVFQYYESGAYGRSLADVAGKATAWVVAQAHKVTKPALVLDIDETALSNWPILVADKFGDFEELSCETMPHGPCGWGSWMAEGRSPAIEPTVALFRAAKENGVAVFFVSGRTEALRPATESNLKAAGYEGYTHLYLRANDSQYQSAADFKAPVRAQIESDGYTIIANMGDQASDLAGGHSQRSFLLPDPFYLVP